VRVRETFIEAKPRRRDGSLLIWYPIALAKFGNCGYCGNEYYLLDCYTAAEVKSLLPRFLIIHRLGKKLKLSPSPTISAPILTHEKCSEIGFMREASELYELLSDEKRAVEVLKRDTPEEYWQPIIPKSVLYLPFLPGKANVPEAIYRTNLSILKEILRKLCLNKGIPPTEWIPAYMLLSLSFKGSSAQFYEGSKTISIKALNAYLFRRGVADKIVKQLGIQHNLQK